MNVDDNLSNIQNIDNIVVEIQQPQPEIPPPPPSMVLDAGTLASVFDRLTNLLSKLEGSSTPQIEHVGSVRSSTAGPSDNARLNPLTQVADSALQGPDTAPGPSKAMQVPPAPGPSHPFAEESGELPSARVGEDSWGPIRSGRLRDSPPEGLPSRLDLVHTKITRHRETINFALSREMSPPAHYYSDWMLSTPRMTIYAVLLLSHVRPPHPVAVGILQMSLLQLRLPPPSTPRSIVTPRVSSFTSTWAFFSQGSMIRFTGPSSSTRRFKRSFTSPWHL